MVARTLHFALHSAAPNVTVVGQGASAPPLALIAVRDVWMGALVPKRWAKRAVTRNAIRRQIYSVSAELESALPVAAHVVRLRAGFDRTRFISATSDELKQAVRQELQNLFARAAVRPTVPVRQDGAE